MNIQFTLTVPEGKSLIAQGIILLPEINRAIKSGKILLKGGTTVSAISEKLTGIKLKISGRITPSGTKICRTEVKVPHSILIQNGKADNVDEILEETVLAMKSEDVFLISANALDSDGNVALMAGAPLGGNPGKIISGLMAEGVTIIIPVGLEKLIPNKISQAVMAAGKKKVDIATGMAVGLIPIIGRIFTEIDAIRTITGLEAVVIGSGGIKGAEGAVVFSVEGPQKECDELMKIIKNIKGVGTSGEEKSLEECDPESSGCVSCPTCMYNKNRNM